MYERLAYYRTKPVFSSQLRLCQIISFLLRTVNTAQLSVTQQMIPLSPESCKHPAAHALLTAHSSGSLCFQAYTIQYNRHSNQASHVWVFTIWLAEEFMFVHCVGMTSWFFFRPLTRIRLKIFMGWSMKWS